MGTIPAKNIVNIQPGVLGAGGDALTLNGVILTTNTLLPTGGAMSFTSITAVKNFFGAASAEYAIAPTYFNGYDNSTLKPTLLYFAPYVATDRAAWLQSGSLSGMTLTQLQALSGVLTIVVDGTSRTSSTINLSSATSFTNAATLITAGFSGGHLVVTWNSVKSVFIVTSATTGVTSTIGYATGTLSAGLKLTSATSALLSQGADADTPTTAMDTVIADTQNWVDFTTMFEPDLDDKLLFADWVQAQNLRYMYVGWDTDANAIVNGNTSSFGAQLLANDYNGVAAVYDTLASAVFVLGTVASIDFARTNGRITLAFKSQSGFTPTVTDEQIAANLLENGYSFYGKYATANDEFNFFFEGQLAGDWLWIDTYVNQVYLNSQLQLANMTLLTQVPSIPYNQAGYSLIRAAFADPINQFLNFGGIRTGIQLSESQKAQLNMAAGLDAATIVQTQGYYLQILDPGAQVRAARGSPVINFWYTDGGAVHHINASSIDII